MEPSTGRFFSLPTTQGNIIAPFRQLRHTSAFELVLVQTQDQFRHEPCRQIPILNQYRYRLGVRATRRLPKAPGSRASGPGPRGPTGLGMTDHLGDTAEKMKFCSLSLYQVSSLHSILHCPSFSVPFLEILAIRNFHRHAFAVALILCLRSCSVVYSSPPVLSFPHGSIIACRWLQPHWC
jgi:hypothetical protein